MPSRNWCGSPSKTPSAVRAEIGELVLVDGATSTKGAGVEPLAHELVTDPLHHSDASRLEDGRALDHGLRHQAEGEEERLAQCGGSNIPPRESRSLWSGR